jgi:zinc/manganese transport system substrate-binding protein
MIGGKNVIVSSIISNPEADPHLFSVSPKTAIKVTDAKVVIYNGVDYDPWMDQLLSSQPSNNKLAIINISEMSGLEKSDNPHIWYNPDVFPALAKKLSEKFSAIQPGNKTYFEKNLASFNDKYKCVWRLIKIIRLKYSGISVTATEPILGHMAKALGLKMEGNDFQHVIMIGSEPSPKMMTEFIDLIKKGKIKVLFYNEQVTSPTTRYILQTAEQNHIPTVGVSETMPTGINVVEWLTKELEETQKALKKAVRNE